MNWKNKWAWGIGVILLSIGGLLVALFDGKEETKPDIGGSIEQVIEGVGIITSDEGNSESGESQSSNTGVQTAEQQ